ncbi:MAG TPA: hypothetical protein VFD00_08385 [Thermoclostridium sp.]|nr:hypothetical protein [Thermoclostridium sp.]
MYALMIVNKKQDVLVMGTPLSIELSWYEGQIGAIPVFETREEAEQVRGDRSIKIYKIEEIRDKE